MWGTHTNTFSLYRAWTSFTQVSAEVESFASYPPLRIAQVQTIREVGRWWSVYGFSSHTTTTLAARWVAAAVALIQAVHI